MQFKFGSAGVTATEIDLSQPLAAQPSGTPAGVIGTSLKGPAFVPITVGLVNDWYSKFGLTDGKKFGPLAVTEWLRNAKALTYLRVLGCGDGTQRQTSGDVNQAGFTVGEQQPNATNGGLLGANTYANGNGAQGRTYFLGCFMADQVGSGLLSDAGLVASGSTTQAVPVVRGIVMAASGVILTLSSSRVASTPPSPTATSSDTNGSQLGEVVLLQNGLAKQDFVLLLNGLKGTPSFPNVITASFDITAPNYLANVLNTNPLNMQQAGHYLYMNFDVPGALALVTGSGIVAGAFGTGATGTGMEPAAFMLTGSTARDTGNSTAPDYEDFRDRFEHPRSPWVVSQPFGGKPHNLFRVHALDDGTGVSTLYKLSIENLAPSSDPANQYGTFDIVLRAWSDTDISPVYIEQWRGLSLNPGDSQYIAAIIGDVHSYYDFDHGPTAQRLAVDGNYVNASNYIRIEVDPSVDLGQVDPTALPVGIRGYHHTVTQGGALSPLTSGSAGLLSTTTASYMVTEPPVPYRLNITQGSGAKTQVNPLLYWGTQFEQVTSVNTPNLSTQPNDSLKSFATFLPEMRTDIADFRVGDNTGAAPTNIGGQNFKVDADTFNNNLFSLMNIQVVTNSVGVADPTNWRYASYVRNGSITAATPNANVGPGTFGTRALQVSDFTQANRRFTKWTFFIQGGFDGVNIFDIDENAIDNAAVEGDLADPNRGTNTGPSVTSYTKALQIMQDVSSVDVMLLAVPGIRNPIVTSAEINTVEARFDALSIIDIEQYDNSGNLITTDAQQPSVTLTVQNFLLRAMNSSFGAAYFPDVVIPDPNTKTNVVAPPSVAVLGAFALNDKLGHPWFAPAGFTRGALQTTLEARVKLSKSNMDLLYNANINPLVAFPGNASGGTNPKGGVVVWGQKTLQQAATALDRVNVRRLLIEIRRRVKDISNTIIFEQNRDATLAAFSAAVTPVLQKIQAQAGLERFKVIIDSSTTTQLDIENNTIRGKIFVQPTKSIEYVSLDFVVTNNISQQV